MLLAVVVSLYTVMTKTDGYQKYFGKNATHWNQMRSKMQYEYSHGEHYTEAAANAPNGMYMIGNETRFFMQKEPYEN